MKLALQTIRDLYSCMEQGNIGKLVAALHDEVWVYTAHCMGGNRRGREGILHQVPAFYRPGTGVKKIVNHFIEHDDLIIVLGTIQLTLPNADINAMSFVDVWHFDNDRIQSVHYYYRDPVELYKYLERSSQI